MDLDSGHKAVPITAEEDARQQKLFAGYRDGLVMLKPDGWFFTTPYVKYANYYTNFKFKPSDVVIVTFPKCGTTWMQEVVWNMRNNPKLDNPMAAAPVNIRSPFLEFDFLQANSHLPSPSENIELMKSFNKYCPGKSIDKGIFLQLAEAIPEPRTIKSHLPFSVLPENILDVCKVIYMIRNPKDVCVSLHHHSQLLKEIDYMGSFDEFVDLFIDDKVVFGPFWTHVKEALERKGNKNFHLCYYEDAKKDPVAEYKKLNQFMGLKLTDEEINNMIEYTSFASMKSRDRVHVGPKPKEEDMDKPNHFINTNIVKKSGGFFRKGKAGDWKNKLTPEQEKKIDGWTVKNSKGLDHRMRYGS